ncbi:MAG: ABC transporter ATP-binding protein/permease, partial [Spirochaetaceae bacterium]|nr:ABC transporter ATP-binding protein/permease [Spirochaetaceae bacterium]
TAFFAVLPLPLITILIIFFGRAVGKRFKKAQESYSTLSDTVRESFAGIHVVKSFRQEGFFIKKFACNNEDYKSANMQLVNLHSLFFPFITLLSGLTTLLVLLVGGKNVILGSMSAGSLVALLSYIQMLIWPMLGAGFTVNMVQRGLVALTRINEILDTEPGIKNEGEHGLESENGKQSCEVSSAAAPLRSALLPGSGNPAAGSGVLRYPHALIELRDFSFAYTSGKNILEHINLSVEEGSHLGIFGRTGSGKSTLIKTLPRILDPPPGTLFIKGKETRCWDLSELRSLFGVSPQDSQLFSDSIERNIAYGLDRWQKEDIENIVSSVALNKDISGFKDGLNTQIGERGLSLSGGQKQRITIARALIIKPEILILDDSFSALDAETEKNILHFINEARKGKTTIIVSHRVFAFRNADYIAVLEDGALSEYGPPGLLLSQDGYYAKCARLQQLTG